ncbi:hypothetical protein B0H13DRAFT_1904921 [Mycena leptocephala]|nr:hypothetical protein B0H13DRAFT_1904921 [Mycena leptocephala]
MPPKLEPTSYQWTENFVQDMIAMNEGKIDRDSYEWPNPKSIDYDTVPYETWQKILGLLRSNDSTEQLNIVSGVPGPETPTHKQIARHVDFTIAERNYFTARRIIQAKELDEAIREHLKPLFAFLQAARQQDLQFKFPEPAQRLVGKLECLRDLLNQLEDMMAGSIDSDVTEPDSVAWDDADATSSQDD